MRIPGKCETLEAQNKKLKKALRLSLSIISEGIDEYWQEENQDRIDMCGVAAVNALKDNTQ